MKIVLGIIFILLVLASVMAIAQEPPYQPNWSFKITADNGSVQGFMAQGIIGVNSASSDGLDVRDSQPCFLVGPGTRGFGMVEDGVLYFRDYKSVKSPLDSAYENTGKKIWDLRIFATPGTPGMPGDIRLFFGTTVLDMIPPTTLQDKNGNSVPVTYTLRMVNNRSMAGAPANDTVWTVPIPTSETTNYFSITLPLLQLTDGTPEAAIAEGYILEFAQNAPVSQEIPSVPEPSSLIALSALVAPALAFGRRRARGNQ